MAKISIVTSGHFCTNPRVWREADALAAANHDVTVISVAYDPVQAELDRQMLKFRSWRYRPAADLRGHWAGSRLRRNWYRVRTRWGRFLVANGINDPYSLGYAVDRLLSTARTERAQLSIMHLEPAFWVGIRLHREGFRVAADFEDWHSENSTPGTGNYYQRGFYRSLESEMLRIAKHVSTTSHSMAGALSRSFCAPRPEVIYNSIPSVGNKPASRLDGVVRLLWFSQTLGRDRGLDALFSALPSLNGNWNLELRANATAAVRNWVDSQISARLRPRVQIEPTVSPDKLSEVVGNNDIGLALEVPLCRNKDLTASNKIFQYLQCGLVVIATDTAGQREVLDMIPEAGNLYPSSDISKLIEILNYWLQNPSKLTAIRTRVHAEANKRFAYEHQTRRLLASVDRALCV